MLQPEMTNEVQMKPAMLTSYVKIWKTVFLNYKSRVHIDKTSALDFPSFQIQHDTVFTSPPTLFHSSNIMLLSAGKDKQCCNKT